MSVVIKVESLSKRYLIGHQRREQYQTLRDTLSQKAVAACNRLVHPFRASSGQPLLEGDDTEELWALKDVSFDVTQGETLGIVGRNGAGKSTLLKILSRITEPSAGRVCLKGRVASLLEVGTGFHSELSGRENIFLNGAILGMGREEIRQKFDEIVAFAEVERFLDTPVKRYSSGMYVRLAFAVAAHLEPEILIVDEVLAVGDVEFQKKCLGKMSEVTGRGRTVIFVSHNMQAVRSLCRRGLLLDQGRIAHVGTADETVERYLALAPLCHAGRPIEPAMHRTFPPDMEIYRVDFLNRYDQPASSILMGETFSIRLHYRIHHAEHRYRFGIVFATSDQTKLATVVSTTGGREHIGGRQGSEGCIMVRMRNIFRAGRYLLTMHVKNALNEEVDVIDNIPLEIYPVSISDQAPGGGGIVWLEEQWLDPVPSE